MYSVYNPNCNHFCPFFQNGVNMKPELSHPFLWEWNNTIIIVVTYRSFWKVKRNIPQQDIITWVIVLQMLF